MWLRYTQKFIVVIGRTEELDKKFITIYIKLYKVIYKGSVIYIRSDNTATMMEDFERLGEEVKVEHDTTTKGDCNFIHNVFDKFSRNNTLFVLTNATPDNYIINRLNLHVQKYLKFKVLITTRNYEWNPTKYEFLIIEGFTNRHFQHRKYNDEFLNPPGVSDVEYLQRLQRPRPLQSIEDFLAPFIHTNMAGRNLSLLERSFN